MSSVNMLCFMLDIRLLLLEKMIMTNWDVVKKITIQEIISEKKERRLKRKERKKIDFKVKNNLNKLSWTRTSRVEAWMIASDYESTLSSSTQIQQKKKNVKDSTSSTKDFTSYRIIRFPLLWTMKLKQNLSLAWKITLLSHDMSWLFDFQYHTSFIKKISSPFT
jgi:hypothetical protein